MAREEIRIGGLGCERCADALTHALRSLRGVTSARVSLDDRIAVVEHNDSLDRTTLLRTIEDEGLEPLGGVR